MERIPRKQFCSDKLPRSRVELHLHLDGSIRPSTIWSLAQQKGIKIGRTTSFDEVKELCRVTRASTLIEFLKVFNIFTPTIIGDVEAIERIAYELCEDEAKQGVAYFEARYSPQSLSNTHGLPAEKCLPLGHKDAVSPEMAVQAVNRGLKRGQTDFNIQCRSILCCVAGFTDWCVDVLDLCEKYSKEGVVGIDSYGDELVNRFSQEVINIFKLAKEKGINRTCHAGEAGPASYVDVAVNEMFAQRIGHGYHVVEDLKLYEECLKKKIHFECCPFSSYFTGAIPSNYNNGFHPIVKFAEDGFNFSLSKDNVTLLQAVLDDEYHYVQQLGLNESHLVRCNLNAARSAFLPPDEKEKLIKNLYTAYGIE